MAEEPNISRAVRRAFAVPDATVQSWRLLNLVADDVRLRGCQVLLRHSVLSVRVEGGRVTSWTVLGPSGQTEIGVDAVVNDAGSGSGEEEGRGSGRERGGLSGESVWGAG